jgi:hypothetical protein
MLTAFSIQTPGDAKTAIEFSQFLGPLAIVAEISEKLETVVRTAATVDRPALFDADDNQKERPDDGAKWQFRALNLAIRIGRRFATGTRGAPETDLRRERR